LLQEKQARLMRDFDVEVDFEAEEAQRQAEIPMLPESGLKVGVLPTASLMCLGYATKQEDRKS
jgi:hypothetical protein